MNENRVANSFSVGFVFFVSTILVIFGLFWSGSGKGIFEDSNLYYVNCPSAGAPAPIE